MALWFQQISRNFTSKIERFVWLRLVPYLVKGQMTVLSNYTYIIAQVKEMLSKVHFTLVSLGNEILKDAIVRVDLSLGTYCILIIRNIKVIHLFFYSGKKSSKWNFVNSPVYIVVLMWGFKSRRSFDLDALNIDNECSALVILSFHSISTFLRYLFKIPYPLTFRQIHSWNKTFVKQYHIRHHCKEN